MVDLAGMIGGSSVVMDFIRNKITTRPNINARDLMHEASLFVKNRAQEYFYNYIYPQIKDVYEMHVMILGEWKEDSPFYVRENFADTLDEKIEQLFDANAQLVTADWLGEHCTDTRLWQEEAMERLAAGFAKDAVKVITWHADKEHGGPKTPAQIMSAVGIVTADIEELLNNKPEASAEEVEKALTNNLAATAQRIHDNIAMMGWSGPELTMMVDNASDSDAGLAQSGIQQLGGEWPADWGALKDGRAQWGVDGLTSYLEQYDPATGNSEIQQSFLPADTVAHVSSEEDEYAAMMGGDAPTQAAAPPPPPPPASTTGGTKRKRTKEDPTGSLPKEFFVILREHTGEEVGGLASMLGLSRPTFDNYAKGKSLFKPTPIHLENLRNLLKQKHEKLKAAEDMLEEI